MADHAPLCNANTAFALDLFKKFADNDRTANVFYSPFSISSALAMVLLGAGGNTSSQMAEVLRFQEAEKPPQAEARQIHLSQQIQKILPAQLRKCLKTKDLSDEVHCRFGSLLPRLHRADAPYALSVANRLYGEQTYQFVEDFLNGTRKHYSAELEAVDFASNSAGARLNINDWVEKQTQGKIKDLLGEGVVDSLTKLVLVNAIYFKGNWNKQFDESKTHDQDFRMNKNEKKSVKMMCMKTKVNHTYVGDVNTQIVELPYKGEDLSMLIFLPMDIEDDSTGLEKLEQQLTYENFMDWTDREKMDKIEVQLGLPRFKLEETYDLKNVLTSMGMEDAFDMARCDFSGMSPRNDLALSKVVHKAFVEVNEEGTEAAAATAAIMMMRCMPMRPAQFIADHPFLFFIRHNETKAILFAGRYCQPPN